MKNILGKAIRVERNKQDLNCSELAKRLEITRQTLSNIEHGRALPSAAILAKLDDIFPKLNIFQKYKKSI